jgi:hypothetical protein
MRVEINRNLFAAYCGLTISGYDMANCSDVNILRLVEAIRSVVFSEKIREYFSHAKTNQISVNPYFPRGNALSAACFFVDAQLDSLLDFITSTGVMKLDEAFIQWISQLPEMLNVITENDGFLPLWEKNNQIISTKMLEYNEIIDRVFSSLNSYGYITDVDVIYSPNILQSPFLADYVSKDGKLYIISSECRENALLHEYLHLSLKEMIPQLEMLVTEYGIEAFIDASRIRAMGYMIDDSIESKCHALEDCIVRGLSAVMIKPLDYSEYYKFNIDSGFLFVKRFIEYSFHMKPMKNMLIPFIYKAIEISKMSV